MQNRRVVSMLLLCCIMMTFLLTGCTQPESKLPQEASYFDLLGLAPEEIDSIAVMYQPSGLLTEEIPAQKVAELTPADSLYKEVLSVLGNASLTLQPELDWRKLESHMIPGNTQLVFYADGKTYSLPVLDVFQKQRSKPNPESWVICGESAVYKAGIDTLWDSKEYMGLALYLDRCAQPYLQESTLPRITIPPYYGLVQNAASWNYDCDYESLFTKSDYIFKGKIFEADSVYRVEVISSYKGSWKDGDIISYQDGTGFCGENGSYFALVNESDRALRPGREYVFFMQKNPYAAVADPSLEPVFLTDRQCGVCEVIQDQVWPIFNALPGTSWFTGQSLEELVQKCK